MKPDCPAESAPGRPARRTRHSAERDARVQSVSLTQYARDCELLLTGPPAGSGGEPGRSQEDLMNGHAGRLRERDADSPKAADPEQAKVRARHCMPDRNVAVGRRVLYLS